MFWHVLTDVEEFTWMEIWTDTNMFGHEPYFRWAILIARYVTSSVTESQILKWVLLREGGIGMVGCITF